MNNYDFIVFVLALLWALLLIASAPCPKSANAAPPPSKQTMLDGMLEINNGGIKLPDYAQDGAGQERVPQIYRTDKDKKQNGFVVKY